MSIDKPYHRTYRKMKKNGNSGYSQWAYIKDPSYAKNPEHYTRSYAILQNDLFHLFEYIEPSDKNLPTFSFRIYELFLRTCTEIETNFKAILVENGYCPKYKKGSKKGKKRGEKDWNINDYKKIDKTHHLSSYKITFPLWDGKENTKEPFKRWKDGKNLQWYEEYNGCKHDRYKNFDLANLKNLLQAISGLNILLYAQFKDIDFAPGNTVLALQGNEYGDNYSIGDYFIIEEPNDWKDSEIYQFDWNELKQEKNKFQKLFT